MLEINRDNSSLRERMRAIRVDLFGENGAFILAGLLGIPEGKLTCMETEGPIPGYLVLAFIEVTEANPRWLLSGTGERYAPFVARGRAGRPGTDGRLAISEK